MTLSDLLLERITLTTILRTVYRKKIGIETPVRRLTQGDKASDKF